MRIIGDIHGKTELYFKVIADAEYTLQVGDHNFDYDHLNSLDPSKHKFFGGNHDNYDLIDSVPHNIGNFGEYTHGGVKFFFIRGAYSVDKQWRIPNISWWEREELNYQESNECIKAYKQAKPDIVISHDCPHCVVPVFITNNWKLTKSNTGNLLDELFSIHQPKRWIFGHHHKTRTEVCGNTTFQCLGELDYIDIS